MAGARLAQIDLVVRDVAETVGFYRRLGLDIPDADIWRTHSGAHHAKVQPAGSVNFEFESRQLALAHDSGFAAERGRAVIIIELDDREAVDRLWRELISGGCQGLQPPFDAFWGARYAIVEDPDGNPVALSSPVDRDRRSAPPKV